MAKSDILIVGAGHAGAQCAILLRQYKFEDSITLVTEELDFPYERPPLSKDFLAGDKAFDRIQLRPMSFWEERNISIVLGCEITVVDPARHIVIDRTGREYSYGKLIWAAGGHARRLDCLGADLAGVHSIRSHRDVVALRQELAVTRDVVVVGGGYIGLEAAAVLGKLGKAVTVLEAQDRVLAGVAGEPLSRFFEAEHRAHGVTIHLDVSVDHITGERGHATGVVLRDGSLLPADMVIVGVGLVPSAGPLAAKISCLDGVDVDEFCRTSLEDVYAIGDCARHVNRFAGGASIRIESVQNANDQATTVAQHILGNAIPYEAVPWFWSHQYDLKLQTVGLSTGHDEMILRGSMESRAFSLIYLRSGRVIALDCVNMTKDYVQGRALVQSSAIVEPELLADAAVPLKTLAAQA